MAIEEKQKSSPRIDRETLDAAQQLIEDLAAKKGVGYEVILEELRGRAASEKDVSAEHKTTLDEIRPAIMGFADMPPTAEEILRTREMLEHVESFTRFGYQIVSYLLQKQPDGSFAGLTITGDQSFFGSIDGTVRYLIEKQGETIDKDFPQVKLQNFLLSGLFKKHDGKIPENVGSRSDTIMILKSQLRDPDGRFLVLGVPSVDAEMNGYPPYRLDRRNRHAKSLQIIEFDSPNSRREFEQILLSEDDPLRFLNNTYSLIFSTDICKKLSGLKGTTGLITVIKDGQPEWYGDDIDKAYRDFEAIGIDYLHSSENGGCARPEII